MAANNKNILYGGDLLEEIPVTLGELILMMLRAHGDKVLQVDALTGETLQADQLVERAARLATWLRRDANVEPGDTIAVVGENSLDFCLAPIAAFLAAATVAPINPDYTNDELSHAISLSKPKIIFCCSRVLPKVVSCIGGKAASHVERVVVFSGRAGPNALPGGGRIAQTLEGALLRTTPEDAQTYECPAVDPKETVATVLCSSGTTGLPKGVLATQFNMLTVITTLRQVTNYDSAEQYDAATIGLVPFFHSMGFMTMFLALTVGRKLIVINRFRLRPFLKAIQDHKVSMLAVPPPIIVLLCQCEFLHEYDLSSLKEVRSGAAPLPVEYEKRLKDKLKVACGQAYGMTETTLGVLFMPPDVSRPGSVGKLMPGMYAKVIDQNTGHPVAANRDGELCFKGPLIMKGYVGDRVSTSATIDKDGWLHTGDVGYYDKDGYFYIVDRVKELIKYKGWQVPPAELEALLMRNENIMDCAVIGIPDPAAGELPAAFIVRKPGSKLTTSDVETWVESKVSNHKRLRGGVQFIDFIPRTASGKILRRKLKEAAIEHIKNNGHPKAKL